METLTPKQRAIRRREQQVLKVARHMVLQGGYHGLSLEVLAEKLSVSRGTIYNHFQCKEEIILALLIETMDRRRAMFQRAAAYADLPRIRLAAIGVASELFVRLYPDHFRVEQIVKSDSIWGKTSQERRQVVRSCQIQCVGIVAGVVRDALATGHLALSEGMLPESLVFGLWSLTEGAYSILATGDTVQQLGINAPYHAIRTNIHRMLDGFDWKPLSSERDYDSDAQQILQTVFQMESSQLKEPW